jgi:predicted transcriptional regulator
MKLNEELKEKIDQYFEQISAEELYEISLNRYGFTEDTSFELINETFTVAKVDRYLANAETGYFSTDDGNDHYHFAA